MEADTVTPSFSSVVTGTIEPDEKISGGNLRDRIAVALSLPLFCDCVISLLDQFIGLFTGNCRRSQPRMKHFRYRHHSTQTRKFAFMLSFFL